MIAWGRSEKQVHDPAVGVLMDKEGWPGTLNSNLQLALGAKEAPSETSVPHGSHKNGIALHLACLNGSFDCIRI